MTLGVFALNTQLEYEALLPLSVHEITTDHKLNTSDVNPNFLFGGTRIDPVSVYTFPRGHFKQAK
jgi:hypothetical protein